MAAYSVRKQTYSFDELTTPPTTSPRQEGRVRAALQVQARQESARLSTSDQIPAGSCHPPGREFGQVGFFGKVFGIGSSSDQVRAGHNLLSVLAKGPELPFEIESISADYEVRVSG